MTQHEGVKNTFIAYQVTWRNVRSQSNWKSRKKFATDIIFMTKK